jgi:hypothetical protein
LSLSNQTDALGVTVDAKALPSPLQRSTKRSSLVNGVLFKKMSAVTETRQLGFQEDSSESSVEEEVLDTLHTTLNIGAQNDTQSSDSSHASAALAATSNEAHPLPSCGRSNDRLTVAVSTTKRLDNRVLLSMIPNRQQVRIKKFSNSSSCPSLRTLFRFCSYLRS